MVFRWNANLDGEKVKPGHFIKGQKITKIKNFKIENFEISKSFPGSLRVQRYIVFMSLHDFSVTYWTSKKGLQRDLSKMSEAITPAPLGYFYNAPHWGGGYFEPPPLISETTGPILKIQAAFESPGKNCQGKKIIDLGVTSDVTGQVKVKMFDISVLVTSASRIAMLSTNKAN